MTQQLRTALNERLAKESLYRIAKATGIPWNTLKRFSSGDEKTGFRSERVDKLAGHLGLKLLPDPEYVEPEFPPLRTNANGKPKARKKS